MTASGDFDDWVGRSTVEHDQFTASLQDRFAAVFDRHGRGEDLPSLPALWHWGLFLPSARQATIDTDGHPPRGTLIPPIARPRRMWASSEVEFVAPVHAGELLVRTSTLEQVFSKQGRTGGLTFVRLDHRIEGPSGLAVIEKQDIVYRDAAAPGATLPPGTPAPAEAHFTSSCRADPTLLMRYSALTFNAHRIHYDRDYAQQVEGYPGLVVHGPLLATLLAENLHRHHPHARLRTFQFFAVRPVFDCHPFDLCGRDEGGGKFALWVRDHEGCIAMRAIVELNEP